MQNLFERPLVSKSDAEKVQQLFCSHFGQMDYRLGTNKAPWGISYFGGVQLGGVGVYLNEGIDNRSVIRSRKHICEDTKHDYILSIPLDAPTVITQFGTSKCCAPGAFRIVTPTAPFTASIETTNTNRKYSELLAIISSSMLHQLVPLIDDFSNVPTVIRPGSGRFMKSLLELALAEGENLPKAQARDLGESLVRAIAMAVLEAPEYELSHSKKNLSSCVRVREAAKDYIAQNLRNPNLNRQLVAQYCGVSERYLNATFANEPVNVSSLIRETRLQHCRESLLNPALNHISIMQIAENWGFPDPSSFNRTYRIRFGKSPGEERKATGLGNVRAVRRARD